MVHLNLRLHNSCVYLQLSLSSLESTEWAFQRCVCSNNHYACVCVLFGNNVARKVADGLCCAQYLVSQL